MSMSTFASIRTMTSNGAHGFDEGRDKTRQIETKRREVPTEEDIVEEREEPQQETVDLSSHSGC